MTAMYAHANTKKHRPSVCVKYGCLICMYVCISVALPTVSGLEVYDVTDNSMRARWRDAEGASGYMILYAPLSSETTDEREVSFGSVHVCV